jgi:hypothetical protein
VYSICFTYNTSGVLPAYVQRPPRGAQGQRGNAYEIVAGDFVSRDFCFVVGRGGCFFVCVQQIFVEVGCCAKRI